VKKRVGVLGGTFDPVHFGHLQLAEIACRECDLDEILFVPAAAPPHKAKSAIVSFEHRCRMIEIACEETGIFQYDCIEGRLPEPSYTVDTLKALSNCGGRDCLLFFIIGTDAFLDLLTWKSYRQVLRMVSLIVGHRRNVDEDRMVDLALNIGYDRKNSSYWCSDWGGRDIFFLETVPVGISSTLVRELGGDRQVIEKYVPVKIVEYIRQNRLYQFGDTGIK
jgi:nicotinate-nucleotide adenylyltransferase